MARLRSTSPTGHTDRTRRLPPAKRVIKFVGRVAFGWMVLTSHLLRPWSVRLIGNALGTAFYAVSGRYRRIAMANLTEVYGSEHLPLPPTFRRGLVGGSEKSPGEIKTLAREVFRHFAREAVQFFYVLSLSRKRIDSNVETTGFEHLDGALADGKGCIIITAHYGNWEMLARKLVICGYKVNVIARDSDDPGITGITTRIRESGGYRVFDRDQPIIGAFRCLVNNECLGILPDQNDADGIVVDFFGKPAATATGPAVLALKSGAHLVPVFCRSLGNGKYRAVAKPKIELVPSGNREDDVRRLTELVNLEIEKEIRSNPSQWLWLHDRWKHGRLRTEVSDD